MPTNAASGAWCSINLIQLSPTDQTPTKIPCQEYKHETKTDTKTGAIQEIVTIESQDASPFEIVINIQPATYSFMNRPLSHSGSEANQLSIQDDYCFEYSLDGICIGHSRHSKTKPKFPYHVTKISSSDGSTYRSLQFAKVNLVDPDDYQEENQVDKICNDENVIKSLGTIRVDVFRATLVYQPKPANTHSELMDVMTTNQMKFSERSKKACLSTTAGLTEQSNYTSPPPLTKWRTIRQDPEPFLQFIFKYKPRSILETEGTITPVVVTATTVEKIDSEKEDESKKKKKRENGINKNNKRIKTEDEDKKIVHKKDKKPRIVNLTGSDNDI
ncbi:hypothetical protein MJO28_000176 [Puccinia striiformis f. sp. tritici]|uniref:Uncharacterized protein n=1 Tax=Puccinia striiformis f. sp. tritici TaxID=168172 RepID=A0ACC0EXI7_9BASI|nr:hypothetical protein Pst134EA_001045 [Puccinia striiformis f. sp. tritici]KAH9473990.1 hypothetical protein Pst134EA_001045 [Puccinia striiformis f. sp. tritici]KAI7962082.1 hypothetical protein MJO28_000176 [Puccinia striiformis f. sp. tritici]